MDFEKSFPKNLALGRLIRLPLTLIPKNLVVPVITGNLRGTRWVVGSSTHGCWLGTYEAFGQLVFVELLKLCEPNCVIFDVGANVGFFSLLTCKSRTDVQVFAFEPNPINIKYLRKHLKLNAIQNVQIVEIALSNENGVFGFSATSGRAEGKLSADGQFQVSTITLDSFVETAQCKLPNLIKVDIEGAELIFLAGAKKSLSKTHPFILLSTHSYKLHCDCHSLLVSYGYEVLELDETTLLAFAPSRSEEVKNLLAKAI